MLDLSPLGRSATQSEYGQQVGCLQSCQPNFALTSAESVQNVHSQELCMAAELRVQYSS